MKIGAMIAPTAADIRDVVVEGPSGIIAVAPPWNRPRFEPSKRRIVWPNGAYAVCLSGEEPERARGLNVDTIWADELGAWAKAEETWRLALLALRAGSNPQVMVTTTPRRLPILKRIMEESTTVATKDTTYANKAHLPEQFMQQIVAMYEGSRLGRQEINAEFLELSEAAWFSRFDPEKHVTVDAEYDQRYPVDLAIDCGVSRTVGAVFLQFRRIGAYQVKATVFGEYCRTGSYSVENANAIKAMSDGLPSRGLLDTVVLDPASGAQTGIGPAAYNEFERVFGSRRTSKAPGGSVGDGLDQLEVMLDTGCLLIHPRCVHLIEAMKDYRRKERGGMILDESEDNQSPAEDMIDALRYGVRAKFPSGREMPTRLVNVHPSRLTGG